MFRTFLVFSRRYATISPFTIYRLWYLSLPSKILVSTISVRVALRWLYDRNLYRIELYGNNVSSKLIFSTKILAIYVEIRIITGWAREWTSFKLIIRHIYDTLRGWLE